MSSKRKLWLHVGLPKTATTAFQSWMRNNADDLAEQGILYPPLFGTGNDKHNFLVGTLRQNRNFERLEKLLETTSVETFVLSDEGLSNHLDDFSDAALAKFRELTQSWDVRIILVTREAEAWTLSYHKQCVLNPDNGASPLWGTSLTVSEMSHHPRIQRLLNTEKLADDLTKAFGATEVRIHEFESHSWFETCLDGIGVERIEPTMLPRTNQSLPDWSIELLRRVNALTGDQSIRNGWKQALQTYLESNHTILTNLSVSETATVDSVTRRAVLKSYDNLMGEQGSETRAFLLSLDPQ